MRDARDLLERAEAHAPAPTFTLNDVHRRGERRQRVHRIEALVIGLAVAVASIGSAFLALREARHTRPAGGTETVLPPATSALLLAGPGQYYYWKVHLIGGCVGGTCLDSGVDYSELRATYWWSPDDSGRIEVEVAHNYGINGGTFDPGQFPNDNGIDVSDFPTDPSRLAPFLLARSQPEGASPAPLVTPPPDGAPQDGRMWRAITDLLQDPHVTPTVRAALVEVAADLQGSRVELAGTDPVGRPAYVITFANWGGDQPERLYVDPATHELLAWTTSSRPGAAESYKLDFVVEAAGISPSTRDAPEVSPIPAPATPLPAAVPSPTVS